MALVAQVANSAASVAAQRIGAALSDAQYFESNMIALEQIRRQLDSSSTKDKLDAMKRVIALISLGKDASTFFPEVVKNVAASSLEVKKLVYLYLVHYAEFKQDLALLAINSFQKDLSDPNQHIRALSLRVLSSIRVKIILQVVIHAIGKSAKDSSAYVRKAAAYAICKVCELDAASKEALMGCLTDLISDRSTQVLGSAIVAFEEICPDSFELIHPHFRRICNSLKSIDPWGQIAAMQMLLRYARANFADPYPADAPKPETFNGVDENDFYRSTSSGPSSARNKDLSLLLSSVQPLFFSLNNSVVMSAISVFFHLASPAEFSLHAIKPLMRLVNTSDDGSQVVGLRLAAAVAVRHPAALLPYISEFYVSAGHTAPVRELRMQVLNTLCQMAGDPLGLGSRAQARRELLFELQDYLFRSDKRLAAAAARAIGSLATAHPESTIVIVKLLSTVVSTAQAPAVVTEAIGVLRGLLQRHPEAQAKALPQLIAMLLNVDPAEEKIGSVTEPAARASIVWLIGEFYNHVQGVALEALRILVKGFAGEAAVVKLQILNLAAKLLAVNVSNGNSLESSGVLRNGSANTEVYHKLLEYVCMCARYDASHDVRDKARVLHALFLTETVSPLRLKACAAFLSKKPVKQTRVDVSSAESIDKELTSSFVLGSMSHVLGEMRLPGARRLRPWALQDTDDALRVEAEGDNSVSFEREYTGISSANFGHMPPVAGGTSNSVWPSANGLSVESFQRSQVGQALGLAPPVSNPEPPANLFARPSHRGIDVNNIDTDKFYESDDGSSSEYETASSDEESDGENDVNAEQQVIGDATASSGASPRQGRLESRQPTSTSNYDLEALLGIQEKSASPVAGKTNTSPMLLSSGSTGDVRAWKRGIESWNAGGIEVDFCFSRFVAPRGSEWTPTLFRLTNKLASAATAVTISSASDSELVCDGNMIPILQPGEAVEVSGNAHFHGKVSTIKFTIEVAGVKHETGALKPNAGEVVRPDPSMTPAEFLKNEKSLRGMFGSDAKLELQFPATKSNMELTKNIEACVTQAAFFACLGIGNIAANMSKAEDSILFAGFLPAKDALGVSTEKKPILLRVVLSREQSALKSEVRLWIGCEDVLFGTNLKQALCSALLESRSLVN